MYTPELQAKIALWRQKAAQGTLSRDEMREAILALREGRVGAAVASESSRRKRAKTEVPDANELLAGLDNL